MDCVLATVRNTGTNFALKILEQRFDRHYLTEKRRGDAVWFGHCEAAHMARLEDKASKYPLVLTMRDPMKVAVSWRKRGREMGNDFREMWRNLFNLKDCFDDSFWLPVDTPDRQEYMNAICDRFDFNFQTDWQPVCSTGNNYPYKGGMRMSEVEAFIEGLPFEQFGY